MITDLRLTHSEEMEGLELVAWIRRTAPWVRVVLMTAAGSSEIEREAKAHGAADYWNKSISPDEILSRVESSGIPITRKNPN